MGTLRPATAVHASPDTVAVMRALAAAGDGLPGREPDWRPSADGALSAVEPLTVERIMVDHDVPGAGGYLVTASDGVPAFTGDIRFHGRAPERAWRLAERAAGCAMFVTEGTALGLPVLPGSVRTEDDVVRDFAKRSRRSAGTSCRSRCTPATWSAEVGLEGIKDDPGAFVYQPDLRDLRGIPDLADLPVGAGTVWPHAYGEPLGPFESRGRCSSNGWRSWASRCAEPHRRAGAGCIGSAGPGACCPSWREPMTWAETRSGVPVHDLEPQWVPERL